MSEPFIGEIMQVGFNFAPRGWALCDGALMAISQNTALFSLLGTTFGGDGRTTFGLPDLRGRSAVHVGNAPGLDTITWGEKAGAIQIQLTNQTLANHNHGLSAATIRVNGGGPNDGDETNPVGHFPGQDTTDRFYESSNGVGATGGVAGATDAAGGSQLINIRNPFLGIYHCIAMVGLFPSRN